VGISTVIPFSSAAENAAGTIEKKAVDSLGIREAFNATGTAPVYACRAWVNFNGNVWPGVVAIRASGNVSSITDNGIGDYTVNFTAAMPDANFYANAIADNNANITQGPYIITMASNNCRFIMGDYDGQIVAFNAVR
jgi:hypothetical protein